MTKLVNHTRLQLEKGQLALGANIRMSRTPDISKLLKVAGFDWIWCDMEHTVVPMDVASQIAISAIDCGITPLVRVSHHSPEQIVLALTNGFLGAIIPHVETPEQAATVARACRFPPHGTRSAPNVYVQFGYEPTPHAEAARILNENTLCVVMLESQKALRNTEAIAAVDGVDVLWIGGLDLSYDLGVPGDIGNPAIEQACGTVIAAARKYGKFAGIGGGGDDSVVKRYVEMGMRFISSGVDVGFLAQGAKSRAQWLRSLPLTQPD